MLTHFSPESIDTALPALPRLAPATAFNIHLFARLVCVVYFTVLYCTIYCPAGTSQSAEYSSLIAPTLSSSACITTSTIHVRHHGKARVLPFAMSGT